MGPENTATTANECRVTDKRLCPNCRASMSEVDRLLENGALFIWYECPRAHCDGQWLDKRMPPRGPYFS